MSITIGPVHVADVDGTHEPGAVIDTPSAALVNLADNKTLHPESGLPYATHTQAVTAQTAPAPAAKPVPKTESAPEAV